MLNLCIEQTSDIRRKVGVALDYVKSQNSCCSSELLFDVEIVLCELISNVITHSACSALVTVDVDEDFITMKVLGREEFDTSDIALPSNDYEHGRGLYLVKSITTDLKFLDNGRVVKATLAI